VVALASKSHAGYDLGQKIINWITYGADTGSQADTSLLSVISLMINTIAFYMLGVLTIVGAGSYVIHTANKGVPGGQIVSSFWMPLRISVATILMVPLTSGFSSLQYGVITVAETGNTHANLTMEAGLNYLYDFGAYRPVSLLNGEDVVFSWIGSELCKQYINAYTKTNTINLVTTSTGDVTNGFVDKFEYAYKEAESSFSAANPRQGYCGSVSVSSPAKGQMPSGVGSASQNGISDSMASEAHDKLISLLKSIQPSVASIAAKLMSDQSALASMQANGAAAQTQFESALQAARGQSSGLAGEINSVISTFNSGRQSIVAEAVNKANSAAKGKDDWRQQTIDKGWPALGTVFWQINVNQSQINSLAQLLTASSSDPQLDGEWLQDERLHELGRRLMAAKSGYVNSGVNVVGKPSSNASQPIPSLSAIAMAGSDGNGFFDSVKTYLYSSLSGVTRSALQMNSPDDLLINIQYVGSAIGTGAELLYISKAVALTGITVGASMANETGKAVSSNIFSYILPIGIGARLAGGLGQVTKDIIESISRFLMPLIDTMLSILIGVGFIAGVVLPTIPLSIWFMGVISWMLFFIECLLVSPFWLAAHGTAEKEGWGTEHTRQGYMLMIGLYLNPILRVVGFFAIFIALKPIAILVSWFFDYVHGVLDSGFVFLFSSIGAVVVCIMFAYSAIVRVFGLPSELFERGLRWVNGGQEVTGDGHSEEKVRNNFLAFVGRAEGAITKGMPGLGGQKEGKPSSGGGREGTEGNR
jgi:conjugal transfer/type IV secretion protein DotA/TraY